MNVKLFEASLPQAAFSAKQVLENEAKVASLQNIDMYSLMKSAGSAIFQHMQKEYPSYKKLLVVCGKGNNAGDGFVVARLALQANWQVQLIQTEALEALKGDAKQAYADLIALENIPYNIGIINRGSESSAEINAFNPDIIVDAIFGIGFKGSMPAELHELVLAMNKHAAAIVSVDIPSGLCANTGVITSFAVIADTTVTFIAIKQGLLTGQAANYIGKLYFADLILGNSFNQQVTSKVIIEGSKVLQYLPVRAAASHKGNIGLLMAVGGNQGFAGAIRLAAEGALRCGAALVSVCCHQQSTLLVANGRPELMIAPSHTELLSHAPAFAKAKLYILGPGLGKDSWAESLFDLVLKQNKPCVIDADGLQLLARKKISFSSAHERQWVCTPHPGEAAALLACSVAEIEQDRFAAVKQIAKQFHCICVLKGSGSLISDGETVWINNTGNSGMASGGMGDVLSGVIGALLMQTKHQNNIESVDLINATRLAVYIHGKAADIIAQNHGKIGMLAGDLLPILWQLVNHKT
ncbi:MAG: NAD(P)H-hydrate dehydratase [Colwellia sp.]|nr:NAD(P)H-hydrate dehydratase [Colwellia sp.]